MRKNILLLAILILPFVLNISMASAEKPAKVKRVSNYLAVFDLEVTGELNPHIVRPLTDSIRLEVLKMGKYEVMERSQMDKILKEQAFQMTGCVAKECAVEAGQMLGVGKVIIGSLGLVGRTYYLSLSQVDVETGKTEGIEEDICRCEPDELIASTKRAARKLMGEKVAEGPQPPEPPMVEPRKPAEPRSPSEKTYQDPTTGMEFVLIKGGCYQMGDTFGDGGSNEKPVHEVCLDDFYMGKYEVTVGQFKEFVRETGYQTEAERGDGSYYITGSEWKKGKDINWRNPGFRQTDRHPVVHVSHNDALALAEWLSRKAGQAVRLPTEAEWEYAARSGGKAYKYSWGSGNPSGNIADISVKREYPKWPWPIWEGYDDGYIYTAPVGSFKPTELGLYDMTGNVWEWCSDWYGEKYYGESRRTNPQGPDSGQMRVIRGGSWDDAPGGLRCSDRFRFEPSFRLDCGGFRLVFSSRQ